MKNTELAIEFTYDDDTKSTMLIPNLKDNFEGKGFNDFLNLLIEKDLVLFNKDSKWGVIDNNCKIIIEPTYGDSIIILQLLSITPHLLSLLNKK